MKKIVVLAMAWWFLCGTNKGPIIVGPFKSQADCTRMSKALIADNAYATPCWEG